MVRLEPVWRALLRAAWLGLLAGSVHAGVMTKAAMQARFPPPLIVGEKEAQLPVWPIFKQEGTATPLLAYVFESIDLAPIPGFSGTPVNLLVAMDPRGVFLDVVVLSQHEPVFLDGLGMQPLLRFVEQYKGLSLQQHIKIGMGSVGRDRAGASIDGVAKATASVRIINQTLLAAALRVARARLGYAAGRDPELLARVRQDTFVPMDWSALLQAGLVQRVRLTHADVEQAFAGSGVERPADAPVDATFSELHVAYLNSPLVGRNLLSEAGWSHLLSRIDEGDHALLVVASGAQGFVGENFVRGAVPQRLALRQGELPIELRDLDLDVELEARLALPPTLQRAETKVFRVIGPAGLDPAQPFELALRVTRERGIVFPERVSREFPLRYQLPADQLLMPESDGKSWHGIWRSRAWELAVLGAALVLLTTVLARPAWVIHTPQRLARFRRAYLLFTLLFVGWFAQAQLSIVNLTALLQAMLAGRELGFFLFDPMSLVLWAFVALTLLLWGRATFCGWLCPFGALQELVSQGAQTLRIRRRRLRPVLDARLKWIKVGVLFVILATAALSPVWTDRVVEIEPFKTAITLNFVRSWPFVLWAVALVFASAFVYKAFCRYLCPLGAGLALLGRVRRLDWIARRAECGTPCQTCRHRCEYQAIRPDGAISYDECFQCLDCVAIHASDQRCAHLIARRRERVIEIRPLPARSRQVEGAP
ncbi:MAG TPA: 4Fe-4S binding protein [Albitalea sp.]